MRIPPFSAALSLGAALYFSGCAGIPSTSTPDEPAPSAETKSAPADTTDSPAKSSDRPARSSDRPAATKAASSDDLPADTAAANAKLVAQLDDATKELAKLRLANARLKSGRDTTASSSSSTSATKSDPTDDKLASTFQSYGQFKQELVKYFAELDRLKDENAALNARLKDGSADLKDRVARLEKDLQTEKNARARAEQSAAKLKDQLRAVAGAVAAAGVAADSSADAPPTARLETNASRSRASADSNGVRTHVVKDGETLEQIAERYYGDSDKWRVLRDANRGRLPLDGSLPAGLELEIPPK